MNSTLMHDVLFVAVPARYQEVKAKNQDLALQWRLKTREALSKALDCGYEVTDFVKTNGDIHYYVVTKNKVGGNEMEIQHIILRHVKMELLEPFTTSIFTETHKEFILVEILGKNGLSGWAESVASPEPYYKEETLKTNWHIMEDYLIPLLLQHPVSHPSELQKLFEPIRGNSMAKAALEGAMWDLYARSNNEPLWKALGGTKKPLMLGLV